MDLLEYELCSSVYTKLTEFNKNTHNSTQLIHEKTQNKNAHEMIKKILREAAMKNVMK